MSTRAKRLLFAGIVVGLVCAGTAGAEVSVSITITGSIDELLPILEHLRGLGIGVASDAAEDDSLKLQVHSVISEEEAALPGGPAAKPQLGLRDLEVEPRAVKRGNPVLVTVKLSDPDHVVDTVAVTLGDATFDLYDDGTNGDSKALDDVWSRLLSVAETTDTGEQSLRAHAFDVHGDRVLVAGGDGKAAPLSAEGKVTVTE